MGPPSTPCLHQPVDLMSVEFNMNKWKAIPKHLQQLFEASVAWHSLDHYTAIQAADIAAVPKYAKLGVQVIRLKDSDIAKFKRFAPELWVTWAKKHPLAMKAFKSQLEYMKSVKVGYYTDADMVDRNGKKLVF